MNEAEYLKAVGKKIKTIRLSKGLSQIELGYACGFDKPNMNRIEAGGNNLTIRTLIKIAGVLEVHIKDLLP